MIISWVTFRQVDLQLESGEYFLSDKKKSAKKWQERQEKQAEKTAESKRKREEAFVPPKVWSFDIRIYVKAFLCCVIDLLFRLAILGKHKTGC